MSFLNINFLNESQISSFSALLQVLNLISFITCFFVVLTFLFYKRAHPNYMVLHLAIGATLLSLFVSLGAFLGITDVTNNHALCTIQGLGIQFSQLVVLWWFFFITVNMYMTMVLHVETEKYSWKMIVIGWIFPLLQSLPPLLSDKYGPKVIWCWVDSGVTYASWEIGCFYAELVILLAISAFLWTRVVFSGSWVSTMVKMPTYVQMSMFRHIIGVSIFILYFLFIALDRFYLIFHDSVGAPYYLLLLVIQAVVMSTQGLVVFLVYGTAKDNFHLWKCYFSKENEYKRVNQSVA